MTQKQIMLTKHNNKFINLLGINNQIKITNLVNLGNGIDPKFATQKRV